MPTRVAPCPHGEQALRPGSDCDECASHEARLAARDEGDVDSVANDSHHRLWSAPRLHRGIHFFEICGTRADEGCGELAGSRDSLARDDAPLELHLTCWCAPSTILDVADQRLAGPCHDAEHG